MEKERDEAKEESYIARLAAVAAGDARARAKDHLARVRDALVIAEEAKCKAEAEIACLESERPFYWSLGRQRIKYPPFISKPVKTKKPWRRTTRRPWR